MVVNFKPESSSAEGSSFGELPLQETGSSTWRVKMRTPTWQPPTDVFETEEALVVRIEVAGMRETDFTIELDERTLSIRGFRSDFAERRAYHQMEIRFGEFSLDVELPAAVIADQVNAVYANGFLRVTLPKAQSRPIRNQK